MDQPTTSNSQNGVVEVQGMFAYTPSQEALANFFPMFKAVCQESARVVFGDDYPLLPDKSNGMTQMFYYGSMDTNLMASSIASVLMQRTDQMSQSRQKYQADADKLNMYLQDCYARLVHFEYPFNGVPVLDADKLNGKEPVHHFLFNTNSVTIQNIETYKTEFPEYFEFMQQFSKQYSDLFQKFMICLQTRDSLAKNHETVTRTITELTMSINSIRERLNRLQTSGVFPAEEYGPALRPLVCAWLGEISSDDQKMTQFCDSFCEINNNLETRMFNATPYEFHYIACPSVITSENFISLQLRSRAIVSDYFNLRAQHAAEMKLRVANILKQHSDQKREIKINMLDAFGQKSQKDVNAINELMNLMDHQQQQKAQPQPQEQEQMTSPMDEGEEGESIATDNKHRKRTQTDLEDDLTLQCHSKAKTVAAPPPLGDSSSPPLDEETKQQILDSILPESFRNEIQRRSLDMPSKIKIPNTAKFNDIVSTNAQYALVAYIPSAHGKMHSSEYGILGFITCSDDKQRLSKLADEIHKHHVFSNVELYILRRGAVTLLPSTPEWNVFHQTETVKHSFNQEFIDNQEKQQSKFGIPESYMDRANASSNAIMTE